MRCELGEREPFVEWPGMMRWLVMLVLAAACGADGTTSGAHAARLGVCALCGSDGDCETGICREYGDGYRKCANTCSPAEPASDCPAPSSGGCNNMGYCMCPQYQPPADADTSGTYKDAAMAPTTDAGL